MVFRTVVSWGWSPISITALAVLGYILGWPIEVMAPALILILVVSLLVVVFGARKKELELALLRLRQLCAYFNRRFMGNSSLSIFPIIDSLLNVDNPQLWEWARSCNVSQRIFNDWCDSFVSRVESDITTRRFNVYSRAYLNELWLITNHYYDFIEQFYEVGQKVEIPQDIIDQYNKFVVEYNSFAQNFRDNIIELKAATKTEIESSSVKMGNEIHKW